MGCLQGIFAGARVEKHTYKYAKYVRIYQFLTIRDKVIKDVRIKRFYVWVPYNEYLHML